MSYNWKCCSFYPNNFDASALICEKRFVVVLKERDNLCSLSSFIYAALPFSASSSSVNSRWKVEKKCCISRRASSSSSQMFSVPAR